ncbi:MAG: hypothetical protein RBU37_01775 [Myxococcota bacterium]|jgi:hypothetical protein|nr:hypothetical protein [Myxococcota bacterium]
MHSFAPEHRPLFRWQTVFPVLFLGFVVSTSAFATPEEKLVEQLDAMNAILERNLESPKDGLIELRQYLRVHLPEMAEQFATLIVELDTIEDDEKRTVRFEELRIGLKGPYDELNQRVEALMVATLADPDALEYFTAFGDGWKHLADRIEGLENGGRSEDAERLVSHMETLGRIIEENNQNCERMGEALNTFADANAEEIHGLIQKLKDDKAAQWKYKERMDLVEKQMEYMGDCYLDQGVMKALETLRRN